MGQCILACACPVYFAIYNSSRWLPICHLSPSLIGTSNGLPVTSYSSVAPLLARQFCRLQGLGAQYQPSVRGPSPVHTAPVSTPLQVEAWCQALCTHPDQVWVGHLISGLQHGFRIGLRAAPSGPSPRGNAPSAETHSQVISSFLQEQVQQGFMVGPLSPHLCSHIRLSRMAVVPKKTPGKFRVIVNLSAPVGGSVNDNIHRDLTHVAYSSIDDAALLIHHLGQHALMAKIDIRNAYRLIPVHPDDRQCLGVSWHGQVFVDCQLPFGLASSPAIFSAVAEALEWILRSRGVRCIMHYLDNFLLLGAPGTDECEQALRMTLSTCAELGVPLALDKIEGPATQLDFLGINLNSSSMSVSLPLRKISDLHHLLLHWSRQRSVRDVHQFQSLIGHLVLATQVVPLGKAFLNRLFPMAQDLRPGQARRLNAETRADILWWLSFCQRWSGISTQQFLLLRDPDRHLFTDASGSWGCGAWVSPNWFHLSWEGFTQLHSIALKELFPIILACAVWGRQWQGQYILCHSDNVAAVSQVNHLHARDPLAAHFLRCLAFFQALFDFRIRAVHISGQLNRGADDLSRNRVDQFLVSHPAISPSPSQVSRRALDLPLSQCSSDWTSPQWRQLFSNFWMQG